MIGLEDYYLGWIIQPLNMQGTVWYLYNRDDTLRQKGFEIEGNKFDCFKFINRKVRRNRG